MSTYNGWANYATWRVNLELFDGFELREFTDDESAYEVGQFLKDYAAAVIEQSSDEGLARDYALAFLSDVNWREIAEHMLEDITAEA